MRPFLDAFCLSKLLFCLNTRLHQSAGKNPLVQICLGVETILVVSLKGSLLQESGILGHHLCPPCNKPVTVITSENCKERLLITWRVRKAETEQVCLWGCWTCTSDGYGTKHRAGILVSCRAGWDPFCLGCLTAGLGGRRPKMVQKSGCSSSHGVLLAVLCQQVHRWSWSCEIPASRLCSCSGLRKSHCVYDSTVVSEVIWHGMTRDYISGAWNNSKPF